MTKPTRVTLLAFCTLALCVTRGDASPATASVTETVHPTIELVTDPIPPSTVANTWLEDHGDGSKASATSVERLGLPVTIALVVSSERVWLRSNEFENDRRPASGYALVETMVQHLTGTSNSKLLVITYDREARVTLPPTTLSELPPRPLGQVENYGNDGRAIELGIRLGLDQLATVSTPRKLLVIVGSGHGGPDTERAVIDDLAHRARNESVEIVAINYSLDFEGERNSTKSVLRGVVGIEEVGSPKEAIATLQAILADSRDSYRVLLDARNLSWDGELHSVTLHAGEYNLGPIALHLPPHAANRTFRHGGGH